MAEQFDVTPSAPQPEGFDVAALAHRAVSQAVAAVATLDTLPPSARAACLAGMVARGEVSPAVAASVGRGLWPASARKP